MKAIYLILLFGCFCATMPITGFGAGASPRHARIAKKKSTAWKKSLRRPAVNNKLSDRNVIALTLWGECRGEPWAGKYLVAEVIANRSLKNCRSAREVCLSPLQFSCWNTAAGKRKLIAQVGKNDRTQAWKDCLALADMILNPAYRPTSHATHYHALSIMPKWAKDFKLCAIVGNHKFYRTKA